MDEEMTCFAASARSNRPTPVEPVNDSLRTRASDSMAAVSGPGSEVVTTFTTPGGTPASSYKAASAYAVNGVSLAGLRITVQPAASAGAILRVAMAAGKFHGVIRTQMPMGW